MLRSAPRNDEDTRIDVLFSNVCHMSVPARLAGLTIEEDVPEGGLPEGPRRNRASPTRNSG